MSQFLKPISVDFLELLMKRRHLKHFKKSANKFTKDKKMMKTECLALTLL